MTKLTTEPFLQQNHKQIKVHEKTCFNDTLTTAIQVF